MLRRVVLTMGLWGALAMGLAQNTPGPRGLPENATQRVSEHVYAITGFPNIGIIVGSRATMVVDTGMGVRNGAVVVREVEKLAKAPNLYLTTTHFHPEHATGEQAFPPRTVIVRPAVQQEEMDQRGDEFVEMFRNRSSLNKELLEGVRLRRPDIVFDREIMINLGGVTAQLLWWGGGHTKGDELIFVVEDAVLLSGDIVQNKLVPGMPNADSSVKGWLALLDRIETLEPKYIIPDHGGFGDASLIHQQRAFMRNVQRRGEELKREGVPVEEAGKRLEEELKTNYADWPNLSAIANVVRRVYAEAP